MRRSRAIGLQRFLAWADGSCGWMPTRNSGEAILILTRRNGERTATHYEFAIHDAVNSFAALVRLAAESLNVDVTSLSTRLTSTG